MNLQITIVFVTICSVQENVKYTNEDAGDSTFNQNLRQLTLFLFIAII